MKWSCLSFVILTIPRLAFAGEGNADAREQCRSLVSGTYLGFMNDLDLLKSHLNATSETSYSLKAKKNLSLKELKALEAKNEALKIPAAELDENLIGIRASIDSTTSSLEESDARIVSIKDQIVAKEKGFKAFHELLRPVFSVSVAKVIHQGAYPIKLEYRHPCNVYQTLCPLPKEQASALLRLAKSLEDPTACERYAQMR